MPSCSSHRCQDFLHRQFFPALLLFLAAATAPAQSNTRSLQGEPNHEIYFETMIPVSQTRLIAAADGSDLFTAGVEYNAHFRRHIFLHYLNPLSVGFDFLGPLVHARVDWAPEFLPVAVLREPAKTNFWGGNLSPNDKQYLYGIGLSPIGYRMVWRPSKNIKPFFDGRIGGIAFTQKALSPWASYANFTAQATIGVQTRINTRMDLRIGAQLFHFSNLYFAQSNPGLDVPAVNFGLSYHLPFRK